MKTTAPSVAAWRVLLRSWHELSRVRARAVFRDPRFDGFRSMTWRHVNGRRRGRPESGSVEPNSAIRQPTRSSVTARVSARWIESAARIAVARRALTSRAGCVDGRQRMAAGTSRRRRPSGVSEVYAGQCPHDAPERRKLPRAVTSSATERVCARVVDTAASNRR